jgi:hypothetical protein
MWKTKLSAIDSKKGKWKLIFFTGIISFVFINIFQPFGLYGVDEDQNIDLFFEVSIAVCTVIFVLMISHFALKKIGRISSFTYRTIIVWFLFESLLCGGVWTFLSVLLGDTIISIIGAWLGNAIEYLFLISAPYFLTIFYLNYKEKDSVLKKLLEVVNQEKLSPDSIVSLIESSGVEKIKIPLKDLLYLEASDNYVLVYYQSHQKTEKYILRNTLKNLENNLRPYNLMRCHRSYIVNPLNVSSQTKTAKGLSLQLKTSPEIVIPVSKPYVSEFQKKFK